jgi:hypothetical protein
MKRFGAISGLRARLWSVRQILGLMRCRDPQGRPVNPRLQKPGNAAQEPRGLNFIPLESRAWSTPLR